MNRDRHTASAIETATLDALSPPRFLPGHRLHKFFGSLKGVKQVVRRFWPTVRAEVRGATFVLAPTINSQDRHAWRKADVKEPKSLAALLATVRDGPSLIVDIGANSGFFTVYFAKYAAPGSEVIAFEPNPEIAARLRINLALNPGSTPVDVREVALSDSTGEAVLNIPERNRGEASLGHLDMATRAVTVPTERLGDVLAARAKGRKTVLKIDVEGHEAEVLGPVLTDSSAPKPDAILLEVSHAGRWSMDLEQALRDAGYSAVFSAEHNKLYTLQPTGRADR